MNESTITLQGYVGNDPVLRSAGGHPVANFRVACTPRRLNRDSGEWADAPTQWYTVSAWRQLGENVARSLHKGDPVVVHGRLMARSYVNKDGFEVNTFDIEANLVGHDLNRGRTVAVKNSEGRAAPPETMASQRTSDPGDPKDPEDAAIAQARRDWGGADLGTPPEFSEAAASEGKDRDTSAA